jgi:hypothetical protein
VGIKNGSLTESLDVSGLPGVPCQTIEERAIWLGSKNELIMLGVNVVLLFDDLT